MQIQATALNANMRRPLTFIHRHIGPAHLEEPRQRQSSWTRSNDGNAFLGQERGRRQGRLLDVIGSLVVFHAFLSRFFPDFSSWPLRNNGTGNNDKLVKLLLKRTDNKSLTRRKGSEISCSSASFVSLSHSTVLTGVLSGLSLFPVPLFLKRFRQARLLSRRQAGKSAR